MCANIVLLRTLLAACIFHLLVAAPPPLSQLIRKPPVPSPPTRLKPCALEKQCVMDAKTQPVCRFDHEARCIRKYASYCHLKIAACKAGTVYSDVSNVYCDLEPYLCEEGFERWSIFFGHEKM